VYRDTARYVIIQVPPKLIMGAMIKNIPRICAIFEIVAGGAAGEGEGPEGGAAESAANKLAAAERERRIQEILANSTSIDAVSSEGAGGGGGGGCGCGNGGGGGGGGGCGGGGGSAN